MHKDLYIVYIEETGKQNHIVLLCEKVAEINTKHFGKAFIFREILTDRIIKPLYDSINERIVNKEISSFKYDNSNKNSYKKISSKKALQILKKISKNAEKYIKIIEDIETNKIKIKLNI